MLIIAAIRNYECSRRSCLAVLSHIPLLLTLSFRASASAIYLNEWIWRRCLVYIIQ